MRHAVLALVCATSACQSYATHDELVKALSSSDPTERRWAADGLRHEGARREDAVSALMEAVSHESYSPALGAELIALGSSGAPEAAEPICHYVHSHDPDIQRWARKAFYLWFPQNSNARCPNP